MSKTNFRARNASLLALIAGLAASPAFAADRPATLTAWEASRTADDSDMVTTGVARGRDRLDSATSTSSIKENEVEKLAPRSLAELLRMMPGIRVEASGGDGSSNSYTVRGLPLVGIGGKYLQFQEDGLPVLEFGDLQNLTSDSFVRVDLNLAQVESIRGGSASTFASNAPGGVINLISKTGEVEGGSLQTTAGLDHGLFRTDLDYGGSLGGGWRFHVGGFYREGEGPRSTGFNGFRGGQVKLNVTRQFDGGFIRISGKLLDDRTPNFQWSPVAVSGTNAKPVFADLPGFSAVNDTLYSRNVPGFLALDPEGVTQEYKYADGQRIRAKSLGLEAQFTIADFSVVERFRYSAISSSVVAIVPVAGIPTIALPAAFHVPSASVTYGSGPKAGQPYTGAYTSLNAAMNSNAPDLDYYTNDLRISRVWNVSGGSLTTTAGLYRSNQQYRVGETIDMTLQTVEGGARSSLVNLNLGAFPVTQNGVLLFSPINNGGNTTRSAMEYSVLAPYGSFNYHLGRIAIGGSLRYDTGRVSGTTASSYGPGDLATRDLNQDGIISGAEMAVAIIPPGRAGPVNYRYHYLSYSTGINFRVSEPFAMFARYSRGARAGADKILGTAAINPADGSLADPVAAFDPVRQAEIGLKYRHGGITFNATGFYAKASETNTQAVAQAGGSVVLQLVTQSYKAYGAELELGVRRGPFSLTAGATFAKAEITAAGDKTLVGKTPRHQPDLFFSVIPQYESGAFTIGASLAGTTGSYAQDVNQLRLPGYTTVGLFAQVRPVDRVELSVNASNLFNTRAITDTIEASLPATGVVVAKTLYGRTISASARLFF